VIGVFITIDRCAVGIIRTDQVWLRRLRTITPPERFQPFSIAVLKAIAGVPSLFPSQQTHSWPQVPSVSPQISTDHTIAAGYDTGSAAAGGPTNKSDQPKLDEPIGYFAPGTVITHHGVIHKVVDANMSKTSVKPVLVRRVTPPVDQLRAKRIDIN